MNNTIITFEIYILLLPTGSKLKNSKHTNDKEQQIGEILCRRKEIILIL